MNFIYVFFRTNISIVYFVYGLVFFMMGFAIALQNTKSSSLILARSFNLLAAFGIIHGLSEWGEVFIPIMETYSRDVTIAVLYFIEVSLIGFSFIFLLAFGLKLCIDTFGFPAKIFWLPKIAAPVWFVAFILYPNLAQRPDIGHFYLLGDVISRYFFALPGSLLSAYAFWQQTDDLSALERPHILSHARKASIMFLLYAVFAGLIVPRAPFFPATWLNIQNLFQHTGIPVAVYRAAICTAIAYHVIHLTAVFNYEYLKTLGEARQEYAVLRERQRIRRDLHDGILQSIFAVGLGLEAARHLAATDSAKTAEIIARENNKLDKINQEIRHYIMDMQQTSFRDRSLKEVVFGMVDDFKLRSALPVSLRIENEEKENLDSVQKEHVYLIIHELLSNIIKHSKAQKAAISLNFQPSYLVLTVADDGIGFPVNKKSSGLQNVLERSRQLNADIDMQSDKKSGTTISLNIPYIPVDS